MAGVPSNGQRVWYKSGSQTWTGTILSMDGAYVHIQWDPGCGRGSGYYTTTEVNPVHYGQLRFKPPTQEAPKGPSVSDADIMRLFR